MAREQRKLAAILAADVVGYSRLMGRDESGTLARMRAHRRERFEPMLTRHGGRLVKLTGDGALAEFPSAVDALSAAIEFQQSMVASNADQPESSRMVFRIGLHLGDLIVDGNDLYGDGVNVAARLEAEAPPGGVVISRTVHEAVDGRLRATFEDLGSLALKNIERPIQAFKVHWRPADWQTSTAASDVEPSSVVGQSASVLLTLPSKPSIAILPFRNMSDDPAQEYFADGIVEDIITALSRYKSLFVISRNSSFTYKGTAVDIKKIGRELGVRYVLEGSVRKAGGRMRITGQLIESETGADLWADRFDGALEDVFDLQDQVTSSVVGQLTVQVELAEMERAKRKPTASLDAYDYYLRGLKDLYKVTREANDAALALFRQAIELDEDFALAYAYAGYVYVLRKQSRWTSDSGEDNEHAVQLSRRAIELGRDDPLALAIGGLILAFVAGELDVGEECIASALSMNSNLAFGWGFGGLIKVWLGESERALQYIERALRLSPRDPHNVQLNTGAALAHFFDGRFDQTVRLAEKVTAHSPTFLAAWRTLAIGCALGGDVDRANRAARKFLELDPSARVSSLVSELPLRQSADRALYAEGLRRAGFPE